MAVNTKNYNLKKPSPEDFFNVEDQNGNMDIIDNELNRLNANNHDTVQKVSSVNSELVSHLSDYVRQPGYAITTGSVNAYAATLNPVPVLTDGTGVVVKIHAANTGASTLNLNGLGAKPIIDSKGYQVKAGKLLYGRIYSLKYDGANFQLQGEGGEIPKIPNILKNGHYNSQGNSWTPIRFISVSYPTDTSLGVAFCGQTSESFPEAFLYQYGIRFKKGHKYYIWWSIYSTANTSTEAYFPEYGESVTTTYNIPAKAWTFCSGIVAHPTFDDSVQNFRLDVNNNYQVISVYITSIMMLDLTDSFGAGNEPSKEELDAMVQKNGGWWDSDLQLLTVDADAWSSDILNNKVAYAKGLRTKGSMPDYTGVSVDCGGRAADGNGNLWINPQQGYYTGASAVKVYDSNYIGANIVSGKSIFGLSGVFNGKRWASGTSAPSTDTLVFSYVQGGDAGFYYTSVTGLTFKPTSIIVKFLSISGSQMFYVLYDEGTENSMYPKSVKMFFVSSSTLTTNSYHVKGDAGAASVTNTGFLLPMPAGWNNMSGRPWAWIAYE